MKDARSRLADATKISHSLAPRLRQRVEPEDVDHDLDDREHARLHHRDRVQQRADRRRRHHRRRQPEMQRHHRRLADAEHVEREQQRDHAGAGLAGRGCRRA